MASVVRMPSVLAGATEAAIANWLVAPGDTVAVGDPIEIETVSSRQTYRIAKISIVSQTDVDVLDATSEPTVTLVTCYPFYFVGSAPQRYIVSAVAENHSALGPQRKEARSTAD